MLAAFTGSAHSTDGRCGEGISEGKRYRRSPNHPLWPDLQQTQSPLSTLADGTKVSRTHSTDEDQGTETVLDQQSAV